MTKQSLSVQAIIDADDLPCFALDRQLRYTAFNQAHAAAMRELYGAEIILGGRLPDYQTVAADRETALANLERALGGERVLASDFSGEEDRRHYFDVVHTPLKDDAGAVVGVLVRAQDVNRAHQNDRRYGLFLENVSDGYAYCRMLCDGEGLPVDWVYLAVNPAFERLTSLTDVVGKRVTEVLPTIKEDAPGLFDLFNKVVQSGEPAGFDADFRQSGTWLHFEAMRPEPGHFVAVLSDITERRAADLARQASEARRQAVLDSMLDPHVLLQAVRDESGAIVDFVYADANRAACEYVRMDCEELVGARLLDLLPGHAESGMLALYAAAVDSGEPLVLDDYPYPNEILDSERRYDIRGVRVGDALSFTWRDVTDRHRAEAARDSVELAARVGTVHYDLRDDTSHWSKGMSALVGVDLDAFGDQGAGREQRLRAAMERLAPGEAERMETLRKASFKGEFGTSDFRVVHGDGSEHVLRATGTGTSDADGKLVEMDVFWQEVTEQFVAEDALRESEDLFRYLFDHSVIGKATIDMPGRFVRVNDALCRMLGYPREELVGLEVGRVLLPDEVEVAAANRSALADGTLDEERGRRRYVAKDGSIVVGDFAFSLRRDADGQPLYYVNSIVDVTAEVAAAGRIALLEETRSLAERIGHAGSVRFNLVTGEMLLSPEVYRLMDIPPDTDPACLAALSLERTHPDDRDLLTDPLEEIARTGHTRSLDFRVVWRDGSEHVLHREGHAELEDGRPVAVVGYMTDVTEQRHTEAALRLATDRLALATRAGGVGVWDWDVSTDTLVWDEQMFTLYGIRREQFAGAYEAWRAGLHPDDRERGDAEIQAVLQGEQELDTEFRVLWPDGTEHAIRALALVQRDEAGAPTRMIGTNWDITELKSAAAEVRRLNADLERRVAERTHDLTLANSELEDFVYSIAHDLRSPLRALGSFSEIVSADYSDVIDETGRGYLQRIHAAAVHMGEVMDALLALSRVNRTDLLVQDVDLSALARGVADQLREAEPQRSVQFEIEDGLVARADASLCEVLLQNLLGNAWKFGAGEPSARISFGRVTVDGHTVLCVGDNGVGFDQKYAERLFKPFERLHAPSEFPGTGIGLATVGRIVARFEGDCWAEGRVGEGAKVFFTLPTPQSAD